MTMLKELGLKLPKEVLFNPDLCEFEDELRAGNKGYLEETMSDYLSDEYGMTHDGYDWCFV